MPNLDGTETIKPTPFDTHEQVVRQSHEHTKDGYVAKEYEPAEYPKHLNFTREDGSVDTYVANNADEAGRAQNRRVDIILLRRQAPLR